MKILVTGGAGFIGSHLVRELVSKGHGVTVLDSLVKQVHGSDGQSRVEQWENVEFVKGDVRDLEVWTHALYDCDAVYHLAAEVGVGQSMYEITRYMEANVMGTANMLQALVDTKVPVRKVIVASSMSIYGEGEYLCLHCNSYKATVRRDEEDLDNRMWEPRCVVCGGLVTPLPTSEDKVLAPSSVYSISKRDQEELCLTVGRAYDIPTVALRFFSVYGPGQALSNPYTGVAAIFASRLLDGNAPVIYEDGKQIRDFVHVSDIVQGLVLALEKDGADGQAINLGGGMSVTVGHVAKAIAASLDVDVEPIMLDRYRRGDIRHCYADIGKARRLLGYSPNISFRDGVDDLVEWVRKQTVDDYLLMAVGELAYRGLSR